MSKGTQLSEAICKTLRACLDLTGIPEGTIIPETGSPYIAPDVTANCIAEDRIAELGQACPVQDRIGYVPA
jgi:hypothetical protein